MKANNNGYAQSLATKIFNQLINIQTNRHIKNNRPRLSNSEVTVEMTPYDLTKGRITFRGRKR